MAKSKKAAAKKAAAKKPAKKAVKKAAPKKTGKVAAKKAAPKKAKKVAAKKAAPKRGLRSLTSWEVVCSVQGVIERGLTRAQAQQKATSHQLETGHKTTFVNGQ